MMRSWLAQTMTAKDKLKSINDAIKARSDEYDRATAEMLNLFAETLIPAIKIFLRVEGTVTIYDIKPFSSKSNMLIVIGTAGTIDDDGVETHAVFEIYVPVLALTGRTEISTFKVIYELYEFMKNSNLSKDDIYALFMDEDFYGIDSLTDNDKFQNLLNVLTAVTDESGFDLSELDQHQLISYRTSSKILNETVN